MPSLHRKICYKHFPDHFDRTIRRRDDGDNPVSRWRHRAIDRGGGWAARCFIRDFSFPPNFSTAKQSHHLTPHHTKNQKWAENGGLADIIIIIGMAANMNMNMGSPQQRFPGEGGGGYGHRMGPNRPESYTDPYGNSYRPSAAYNPPPPRRFGPRNHSDPALYGNNSNGNYYNHNYQPSYDTNTTGSGSGASHGTEPWSNSTDPSSENSSIDKVQQPAGPDLAETYGFNGFGGAPQFQGPILEEYSPRPPPHSQLVHGQGSPLGRPYQGSDLPPPPPPHMNSRDNVQRTPQRGGTLQKFSRNEKNDTLKRTETGEKRKSWLMRRFSKNG